MHNPPHSGRFHNGGVSFTPNALGAADRTEPGNWRAICPQRLAKARPLGLELRADLIATGGRIRLEISIGRPARVGVSISSGRIAAGFTFKAGAAL